MVLFFGSLSFKGPFLFYPLAEQASARNPLSRVAAAGGQPPSKSYSPPPPGSKNPAGGPEGCAASPGRVMGRRGGGVASPFYWGEPPPRGLGGPGPRPRPSSRPPGSRGWGGGFNPPPPGPRGWAVGGPPPGPGAPPLGCVIKTGRGGGVRLATSPRAWAPGGSRGPGPPTPAPAWAPLPSGASFVPGVHLDMGPETPPRAPAFHLRALLAVPGKKGFGPPGVGPSPGKNDGAFPPGVFRSTEGSPGGGTRGANFFSPPEGVGVF